jgi:hypothetical protein
MFGACSSITAVELNGLYTHSQSFAKQISVPESSHEVLSECDASLHRFRSPVSYILRAWKIEAHL